MNNRTRAPQPVGLDLGDIYYTLFRRKWLILSFSAAGIITAMALYLTTPKMYQSEAEVLLRYIMENKTANPTEVNTQVKDVEFRGDAIINAELEILTSLDVAEKVVDVVGIKEILDRVKGGTNRVDAAFYVRSHLETSAPRRGNVIKIVFKHPDPRIPQNVLQQLLVAYFKRHAEIHRAPGILEETLARQTDQLRSSLLLVEDDLRKAKAKAGITALEDAKRTYSEQISRITLELLTAETDLAQWQAAIKEYQKLSPAQVEAVATQIGVPLEKVNVYKSLSSRLEAYRNKERLLLVQNTEENPIVTRLREQITETDRLKSQMEKEYPKLTDPFVRTLLAEKLSQGAADPMAENARIVLLQARTNVLNLQLARIRAEAAKVNEVEPAITELQRKKNLAETNYYFYSTSLEETHLAEARGPGKVTNISPVQAPTPPYPTPTHLFMPMALLIVGGILGGLALAFLMDLYIDQTVKRPADVEAKLGIPLFLTIPNMSFNGHPRLAPSDRPGSSAGEALPSADPKAISHPKAEPAAAIALWDPQHNLRSYSAALRDRLITFFEVNNMTHKPKLVAVTGCSNGAGVSTIAAGLAASLSETGDGNVLLVEMDLATGAAHPFSRGKPASGLMDVLGPETRNAALIQENLYVASATEPDDRLSRVLPKRISQLVPKFKASDYDYIIFDMPMTDQRSITPRLTGLMDMTLLVIESGKTQRDAVKRGSALLTESGGTVKAVLNKNRTYVPKRLHQDF